MNQKLVAENRDYKATLLYLKRRGGSEFERILREVKRSIEAEASDTHDEPYSDKETDMGKQSRSEEIQ